MLAQVNTWVRNFGRFFMFLKFKASFSLPVLATFLIFNQFHLILR